MAHLIDKDALVAEINTLMLDEFKCDSYDEATGFQSALREIEEFIDTLEVKEVDLEKEIKSSIDNLCELGCYTQSLLDNPEDYEGFARPFPKVVNDEIANFAKHFFEFGLKAQKGE